VDVRHRALAHVQGQPDLAPAQDVEPIPNLYLAFGDSITCYPNCWGQASAAVAAQEDAYPVTLEQTLDVRVADSIVVDAGKPEEGTFGGSERITGQVSTHRPKYVLIMEGTNDVTRDKDPADVQTHLETMIDNAREAAGVADVEVMLATIIPRADGLNEETAQMNTLAVLPAAQSRGVPVCDQWGAWMNHPQWPYMLEDDGKHPNAAGRALIADTFYACLLAFFPGVSEETVPPDAWIESVPPTLACGEPTTVPVTWTGADNLSWAVDYDVRVRLNDGAWTEWLMGTADTAGTYVTGDTAYQDRFYFQVRARDLVGNEGAYSEPAYGQVIDVASPTEAHVNPLPPAAVAPFPVSWWGADACSGVTAYGVQYRGEMEVEWQTWLSPTLGQGADFDPPAPAYGERYEFRVRPRDAAGNWGVWSAVEASTLLAQWRLEGGALNVRHEPVAAAMVDLDPAALHLARQPGGRFLAYLATGDSYDLSVARPDRYGPLPAMYDVAVSADVSGLSFILPPADDAVADGGFETGGLAAWRVGGTVPPTLSAVAHTGLGAVRLGGAGESAYLSQGVTPADGEAPTLSFLVRLDQAGVAGTLRVDLAHSGSPSPPITQVVAIDNDIWTHVWYDLTGLVSEPLTLTFQVSDTAAILLDEISLGSALQGLYPAYLPLLSRD
jgi:lysophospholipase L1-like esterase